MIRTIILSLIFIFSCEYIEESKVNLISDTDLMEIQASDFILIDVRTQDEYDLGHITNAINFDFYSDTFQDSILALPKNENIILYCRTNNRSTKTANILKENGFDNISVIKGGITEWVRNGNDIDYTTYSD
tara:strand:- start:664 stop:1056 length:393 start_codon:yes stop_codon:yes gene_type:complete